MLSLLSLHFVCVSRFLLVLALTFLSILGGQNPTKKIFREGWVLLLSIQRGDSGSWSSRRFNADSFSTPHDQEVGEVWLITQLGQGSDYRAQNPPRISFFKVSFPFFGIIYALNRQEEVSFFHFPFINSRKSLTSSWSQLRHCIF